MNLLFEKPGTRSGIQGRCYQLREHDEAFRLWDSGIVGVLTRSATGTGKTIMGCLKIDTWLKRGDDYRAMVISYERQLVWQFAQEIEDWLGITPGIEMESESLETIPNIVVASRASLLVSPRPTDEQVAELAAFGITDLGPAPARACKTYLTHLQKGGDVDDINMEIARLKLAPEANGNRWSRIHKFDWKYNWLVVWDEAHRHAYHLSSVGHIVDWFDQNPKSRRNGITATPKRGDGVSIGDRMFPGIALDYPLYSPTKPCAVGDGYAVPYVQKYIQVEGVDFKSLAKLGEDFDEAELERKLGEEKTLASLVVPLLDLVGDRSTLIFSPGVEMAKDVARFINARSPCLCPCGKVKWQPVKLIGDGAGCECGRLCDPADVIRPGPYAIEIDGNTPESERKQVYRDHQGKKFQFLSVCGLCREGYNDPNVACVAVFRPVSKKASSLAEQMKGRGCRPLRGLVDGLETAEERLTAISQSAKAHCLIVDLVGITGLADCASTVQIYAEGLRDSLEGEDDPDQLAEEIQDRAIALLAEGAAVEIMPVEEAIKRAREEVLAERERIRQEREAAEELARRQAEKRARVNAEVKYTQHDVGEGTSYDPHAATAAQYKLVAFLGMEVHVQRGKRQIGRIIDMLLDRYEPAHVAYQNGLKSDDWTATAPTIKQRECMSKYGLKGAQTPKDASLLLDARFNRDECRTRMLKNIHEAKTAARLNAVGKDMVFIHGVVPPELWAELVEVGKKQRALVSG